MNAKIYAVMVLLSSCGLPDVSQTISGVQRMDTAEIASYVDRTDVYGVSCCHVSEGWAYQQAFTEGSEKQVSQACGYPENSIWSCNQWGVVIMREDGDIGWMVVHESLHYLSFLAYGDWDWDHQRFGGSYYAGTIKEILK